MVVDEEDCNHVYESTDEEDGMLFPINHACLDVIGQM